MKSTETPSKSALLSAHAAAERSAVDAAIAWQNARQSGDPRVEHYAVKLDAAVVAVLDAADAVASC